jgi:menaquinone-dependent protoporphyrinogen oxidase
MKRILVAYASREGQTEKIAHHIARRIEDKGLAVRLINLMKAPTDAGADDCDASIIAASVHRGRHDQELSQFIMRHAPALRRTPSAFVCVSLSAASMHDSDRAAIDEVAQSFFYDIGWYPDHLEHVAGAVRDRQLSLLERYTVHTVMYQKDIPADATGDTELTDWVAVDGFIDSFVAPLQH